MTDENALSKIEELSAIARNKKQEFVDARKANASFDDLSRLAAEYGAAMKAWHKAKYPKKRFNMPSTGYLIRAL